MTAERDPIDTLQGSRLAGLGAPHDPDPGSEPLDLAALADEVARRGDHQLTTFTSEELAATRPEAGEVPGVPEDAWFAGLDADHRRVVLAAATRSLAARGLLTATGGRGVVHGDLRLVHELRAAAPTVVQADVHGDVQGRRVRARHLLCRAHPGLVLHLAAAAGVHRAALRSEPSAGLCLAAVVVDPDVTPGTAAPAELPPPLEGPHRDRAREAIDTAGTSLVATAHHRLADDRVATSRVALWRTSLGPVLWTGAGTGGASLPTPDRGPLRLVDPVVAVAVCVGLVLPALSMETT